MTTSFAVNEFRNLRALAQYPPRATRRYASRPRFESFRCDESLHMEDGGAVRRKVFASAKWGSVPWGFI